MAINFGAADFANIKRDGNFFSPKVSKFRGIFESKSLTFNEIYFMVNILLLHKIKKHNKTNKYIVINEVV